jgi:hypothetical protein
MRNPFKRKDAKWVEGPYRTYDQNTETEVEEFLKPPATGKVDKVCKYLAIPWRITYGTADDVAGPFRIVAPDQDVKQLDKINTDLRLILHKIGFYSQESVWIAERRKLGGAVLVLFDEESEKPPYELLERPINGNITSCEAFGPLEFVVERRTNGKPKHVTLNSLNYHHRTIKVNLDRVIFLNDWGVNDYNLGLGEIRPLWSDVLVHLNVIEGMGELAFRWGTGHPTFFVREGTTDKQLRSLKTQLDANPPNKRSWHALPGFVESMMMMTQQGAAIDFPALLTANIDQFVAKTGYPRPILLGEVSGVVTGGEVNERSYFGNVIAPEQRRITPPIMRMLKKFETYNGFPLPEDTELQFEVRYIETKQSQIENFLNLSQGLSQVPHISLREGRSILRSVGRYDLDDTKLEGKYDLDIIPVLETLRQADEMNQQFNDQGGEEKKDLPAPSQSKQDSSLFLTFDAERPVGIAKLCRDAGVSRNQYYKLLTEVKRQYEENRNLSG